MATAFDNSTASVAWIPSVPCAPDASGTVIGTSLLSEGRDGYVALTNPATGRSKRLYGWRQFKRPDGSRRTSSVALTLLFLAVLSFAAQAQTAEASESRCRVPVGSENLARTSTAIVYRRRQTEAATACLRRTGRTRRLDNPQSDAFAVGPYASAGSILAFGYEEDTVDEPDYFVRERFVAILDLRLQSGLRAVPVGDSVGTLRHLAQVAVRADGAAAWIDCVSHERSCRQRQRRRVVFAGPGAGQTSPQQVIATGRDISVLPISLGAKSVCWNEASRRRCAPVSQASR